jgi:hypothetical protein
MSASQNAFPRIVAGVNGSPPSIAALRWAVHQAQLSGSTIDAVIAWKFPVVAGPRAGDPGQRAEHRLPGDAVGLGVRAR